MNHLKQKNETQFEYMKRLTFNRKELGLSYSQWAKLVADYDCSDDNGRKILYGVRSLLLKLEDELEDGLKVEIGEAENLQELIQELEEKKIELFKEKVKLQDQRRNYFSLIRTEARWESLMDLIRENLEKLEPMKLPVANSVSSLETEGTLVLSDWHIGSLINTPHNQFNLEIAKERIATLKEQALHYCQIHKVTKLNVVIAGDLCSGSIHISTRLNNQEDVVSQTVKCSELLSQLIYDLASELNEVVIHYTVGNHGRINANIKESLDSENFEYFILEFLKLRLQQCQNVSFNDCKYLDKEIVVYEVFGKRIACVHGHREKKPFNSVSTLSDFLGMRLDMVILGHFHNFATQNNVVVNGALSGCDEYSNNLRFNNKPSQTLIIHFNTGGKCLYDIVL